MPAASAALRLNIGRFLRVPTDLSRVGSLACRGILLFALATLMLAAAALAACSRGGRLADLQTVGVAAAAVEPAPLVLLPGEWLSFALDRQGQYWLLPEPALVAPAPAPFATQIMPLSLLPLGGNALLIATNRIGLYRLDLYDSPATASESAAAANGRRLAFSFLADSAAHFEGRTVAPGWLNAGFDSPDLSTLSAFFLLFRHGLYEPEAGLGLGSSLLQVTDRGVAEWPDSGKYFSQLAAEAGEPFALFPQASGQWYVQFRKESADRVDTVYTRWNLAEGSVQLLQRNQFEGSVAARPLRQAPIMLQQAAALLAENLVLDVLLADGSRQAYARGNPAEAIEGQAAITAAAAFIVTSGGTAAYMPAGAEQARLVSLPEPWPGLRYGAVAVLDGAIALQWEENLFPQVGRSGFSLLLLD